MLKILVIGITAMMSISLIIAAMKFYEKFSAPTCGGNLFEIDMMSKVRKIYGTNTSSSLWTVVFINIYDRRLNGISGRTGDFAADKFVQKAIEKTADGEIFEAAAALNRGNYVLITKANDVRVEKFCEEFALPANASKTKSQLPNASFLNVRIGVYKQVSTDVNFDDAVDNARRAARYALDTHRKFCFSNHELQTEAYEKELLERDVNSLIESKSFYMVVQPFVDKSGKIIGGELLTRFRPLGGRSVSLHKHLRAIRQEDLFGKFDFAVLEKCLAWQQSRGFERTGIITCNFTRLTASMPDFLENFCSIVKKYKANPSTIGLEITEDIGDIDRNRLLKNIRAVKEMDFLIFIDDYGSGCASLDDLFSIPIDFLKLDKSLLYHTNTENGRIIFDGICDITKKLGIKLLCEGIENEEQAALADKTGCEVRQGYYYYRPMLVSEYEELCNSENTNFPKKDF